MVADSGKAIASWDRMDQASAGDLVLHYANGSVRGCSIVLAPTRPASRPYDSGTWNNEGRVLDVDYSAFDMPIRLREIPLEMRQNEPKPHAAFTREGAVNQGYFYPLSRALSRAALDVAGIELTDGRDDEPFRINGLSDREGLARIRVEQPALRRRLLAGRSEAPCGLCGEMLTTDYLVAAHIKRRADCSERERADINVAMLACKFGCDAAFELGHLRVREDGSIVVLGPASSARRLARLQGRIASAFSVESRRYFQAHRRIHARSTTASSTLAPSGSA